VPFCPFYRFANFSAVKDKVPDFPRSFSLPCHSFQDTEPGFLLLPALLKGTPPPSFQGRVLRSATASRVQSPPISLSFPG